MRLMTMEKLPEVERLLRPFLIVLKISGIYHGHRKYSRILHVFYASLLTLLAISAPLSQGYCTYITGLSSSASLKLLVLAEYIKTGIVTVWNVSCFPRRMKDFLAHWSNSSTYKNISDVLSKKLKVSILCTVIFLITFDTVLWCGNFYLIIRYEMSYVCLGASSTVPWPNYLLISINSFFAVYQTFIVVISYVVCGYIVKKEFGNIRSKIDDLLRDKHIIDSGDVLQCRQEHEAICKLLEVADDCFLPYLLHVNVYGVLYICLSTYSCINEPDSSIFIPFLIISSLMSFLAFVITGIESGTVNTSAHQHLGLLLKLKTHQLTREAYSEVMLFVTKLTSTEIGFTVMKICVLSKTTILTILGTMVSYVIVVIQLKPGESVITRANNTMAL